MAGGGSRWEPIRGIRSESFWSGCGNDAWCRMWRNMAASRDLGSGIAGGGAKRSRLRAEPEETQARGTGVRLGQASGRNVADEIPRADAGGVDVPPGGECAESAAHATFAGGRARVKQEAPVLGSGTESRPPSTRAAEAAQNSSARPQLQKTTYFSAACSGMP